MMGKKVDLSKLTEEETQHVWAVVQRDFDLRKKEEERLDDLKCKVEKESAKRDLLFNQAHLNKSHCVHCLQPFKFLVNSKCQCQVCHFYTCKNCSHYNKKDQGWVCDSCHIIRVMKISSLEWYHDHIRSRFKHFGSAKVMRSLYGWLQQGQSMGLNMTGSYQHQATTGAYNEDKESEDDLDSAEVQHYNLSFSKLVGQGKDASQKESLIAEADLAAMFHHILQQQGETTSPPGQEFTTEVNLPGNSNWKNLDKNSRHRAGSQWNVPQRSQYCADMDTSDEGMRGNDRMSVHQPHHTRRRSKASFQENVHHSESQFLGLGAHTSADLEEETLKNKLEELTNNITEKGVSSEEEEKTRAESKTLLNTFSDNLPNKDEMVYIAAAKASKLKKVLQEVEEHAQQSGTTDSELSGLEDKVATAAAQVQHAENEVSDIESRIAALSSAGLTVTPTEKARKTSPLKTPSPFISRYMENFQEVQTPEAGNMTSSSNEINKVLSMQQALRRKFNIPIDMPDGQDCFERNALYRGSLTQRNPNGKNRKVDRIFAKPVLTHQ
ncbi:melanophilin [Microcaecilia unicolor]|uniref:Melanophilin n=1 Tax=Microcaecilia unicolor TaxID=1415580 RepID=A0A6P7YDG1_9AMPH|nr:melanophilin [Microcaecilia unicolor]